MRGGRLSFGLWLLLACASPQPVNPTSDAGDGGAADAGRDAGADAGPVGLPFAQACATLNRERCAWYGRCGVVGLDDLSQRDCIAALASTWCGPSTWPARVERGTLRYDPLAAQQCAALFGARACLEVETLPEPCARAWLPDTFAGQGCYDGLTECVDGTCRGASCPRSCQPRAVSGEVCDSSEDCRQGLYCRITALSSGVGQCLPTGGADQLCDVDAPCAAGLTCLSGRCAAPVPVGEPCLAALCDSFGFCSGGPDAGRCEERFDAGQPCTDDQQCALGLLCEGSRCVPARLTQPGEACRPRQRCPPPSTCVGATNLLPGTCGAPRGDGEACALAAGDCQPHLACAPRDGGVDSSCGPRLLEGERCALDGDCQRFARCLAGTCRRIPSLGGNCAVTRACLTGACLTTDAGALCVEPFGPGASCRGPSDCASGRCVTGRCLPGCLP